jgi:hypothetical protein
MHSEAEYLKLHIMELKESQKRLTQSQGPDNEESYIDTFKDNLYKQLSISFAWNLNNNCTNTTLTITTLAHILLTTVNIRYRFYLRNVSINTNMDLILIKRSIIFKKANNKLNMIYISKLSASNLIYFQYWVLLE